MKPELEEVLKHYGVKGMKWRNRKDPEAEDEKDEDQNGDSDEPQDFASFMVEEFLERTMKSIKGMGKKISNIDDVLKKFGKKTLKSLTPKTKTTYKTIPSDYEGKVGKWKVSRPYNKDGTLKNSNKKTKSSTHMNTIKSPSNAQISAAAKLAADTYKRELREKRR